MRKFLADLGRGFGDVFLVCCSLWCARAAQLVADFLPLRQHLAERLCNLLMQCANKVVLRADENSKGSDP
jgi:hypothetical protein